MDKEKIDIEILLNAIARIKRGIEMAVRVNDEKAVEELKDILKALEKQIPKEPDFEGDGYSDGCIVYDTWICPCCGKHYEVDYDDYKHCPSCGQAIDWSGNNE